jgi:hypothetical protein
MLNLVVCKVTARLEKVNIQLICDLSLCVQTHRTLQASPRQIIPNLFHPEAHKRFCFPYDLLKRLNISLPEITKAFFHFIYSNFQHTIQRNFLSTHFSTQQAEPSRLIRWLRSVKWLDDSQTINAQNLEVALEELGKTTMKCWRQVAFRPGFEPGTSQTQMQSAIATSAHTAAKESVHYYGTSIEM